jgi:hypothetical protein
MMKIEELEKKLLQAIEEFNKENKDVRVMYDSNYSSGRIHIKVIEEVDELIPWTQSSHWNL